MAREVFTKTSANLYSLSCKLLQGQKILSNCKKHCHKIIKWQYHVGSPNHVCKFFLLELSSFKKLVQRGINLLSILLNKKNNIVHAELEHLLEVITHATGRASCPMKIVPWERQKGWSKQKNC